MTPPPTDRRWLQPYALLYVLLGAVLLAAIYQGYRRPITVEEPTHLSPSASADDLPRAIAQLDPNTAEWHELSLLPGLGKTVAQAIVAYRQERHLAWHKEHASELPDAAPPVFAQPQDLLPVKGIGPRVLERIQPYLMFTGIRD